MPKPANSNKIKELRKRQGITQAQLADVLGVHVITISKLENGHLPLTLEWLRSIAHALHVDEAELSGSSIRRRIYIKGTISGGASIYKYADDDIHPLDIDLGDPEPTFSEWYVVIGTALWPVFQNGDLVRLTFSPLHGFDTDQLVGKLCAINLMEDPHQIFVGMLQRENSDGSFNFYRLNHKPLESIRIESCALITMALFQPKLPEGMLVHFDPELPPDEN